MKKFEDFIRNQAGFISDAIQNPRMGKFAGGASQLRTERFLDFLMDDAVGPALRIGAKIGGIGALAYGAKYLSDQNTSMGHNIGLMAGGAIVGGIVGGAAVSKGVQDYLKTTTMSPTMGTLMRAGMPMGGVALGAIGGAAIGAVGGGLGMSGVFGGSLGLALGVGGTMAAIGANAFGLDSTLLLRSGFRAMGGGGGALAAAIGIGRSAASIGLQGLQGVERVARGLLTSAPLDIVKGRGAKTMLDAYFPNFRNMGPIDVGNSDFLDKSIERKLISRGASAADAAQTATIKAGTKVHNPMRFAPNPRIVRRVTGAAALFAVGSAIHEAVAPKIAPPTMFFDGVSMRHTNDMGAGGEYGMGILGANSSLNMNYQTAGRIIANAF